MNRKSKIENSSFSAPRYALYALLIVTPMARASVQGWAITLIHIITLIGLALFLLQGTLSRRPAWVRTPLDIPALLVLLVMGTTAGFSLDRRTSLWAALLVLNYVVVFYLTVHTVRTRSQLRELIYVILGVAVFLAVFGLFKKFGDNPFPWWNYTDSHLYYEQLQSASTYGNPNHFSAYMAMAIPVALGLLLTDGRSGNKLLVISITLPLAVALVLALSRGGWLAAAAGLAFMGAVLLTSPHYTKKPILAVGIGSFIFALIVVLGSTPVVKEIRSMELGGKDPSLFSRVVAWKQVIRMISDRPALGTGPGTFSEVFTRYQPPGFAVRMYRAHNDYLQFMADSGVAMAALMLWIGIALYRRGFQKLKNPSRLVRGTTLGALSAITAMLVHSLVDFNLHIPANALLFTVLCGIVASPVPVDNLGEG